MKGFLTMVVLLCLLAGTACAEYWDESTQRPAVCCDDRPGCQVLQTVMMGSFARFDPEDNLNVRVLAAALPRLTAVTEEDFEHFTDYFGVEPETVRELYHIALGNCFRSDLIVNPLAEDMDGQNARIVLGLFLNPTGEGAAAQIEAIRESCTDAEIGILAEHAKVPVGFVEYLLDKSAEPVESGWTAAFAPAD